MRKKIVKKTALLSLMMTAAMGAEAQTHWTYTYDAAGNRTQRVVTTGSGARSKTATNMASLLQGERICASLDASHNRLKIETLGRDNASVIIYDLTGREVMVRHVESQSTQIDLSSLRRGTYILTVGTDDEKKTCKFNK